ncbi:YSIRK-type signal peptide-containing protein [Streptococcus ruminantium]|uniref:YSIRK-type signal peptide-containing protein n=1 Tax=Streptococcus ruminantium TaxID=1917441 RepID=UPI0013EEFB31|nr:YSIRK-type signal peptide-containing protein [Streptococcus ruminantium]
MFSCKKVKVGLVSAAIASLFILASSPVAQASSYRSSDSIGFEFDKDGARGSDSLGFEFEKDGAPGSDRQHDNIPPRGGGNIEICNYDGGNGIISICRGSGTGRYSHWPYNHNYNHDYNYGYDNNGSNKELGWEYEKDGGNGLRYHDDLGPRNTLGLGSVLGDMGRAILH